MAEDGDVGADGVDGGAAERMRDVCYQGSGVHE